MINLSGFSWEGEHRIFPSAMTSGRRRPCSRYIFAVLRRWPMVLEMLVKNTRESLKSAYAFTAMAEAATVNFAGSVDVVTFGSEQYKWHTDLKLFP